MIAKKISIIGGGIGGTSAALALLDAGFEVQIFEKSSFQREVGAGIQISPNASRILIKLGLGNDLENMGVRPEAWHQRRWEDGRTLLRTPLAGTMEDAFGAPHYQMHRADVLGTLGSHLPDGVLKTEKSLVGLTPIGEGVEMKFADGTTASADVVVGADGIHSKTREILFGPNRANFKNCIAFRGLIPRERIAHLDIPVEAQIWMGPGRHFVHYYVRRGELFNFVANVEMDEWKEESWTEPGDPHVVRQAYTGWHPQIQSILEAVEETFVLALHDRKPLKRWSKGRVTLLGDACHPMEPHVAQGAAQAIEDGATLARCLFDYDDAQTALERYEALRIPRTSRVQALADGNRKRFHMLDGREQQMRDAEMAKAVTDFSLANVAWLYGHDAFEIDYSGDTNASPDRT